ncbi:hypothetical protein DVA67_003145 [Solirubrobacter sp. CPCC 204708]|uniref:Uncharacterized protein n=1 Tax=Solirubrobacter deserti TaxID=2282478 RepID=A0ABT4RNP9_9ACTN|nr:hypothetical protein [Solirubrobacter deserti]MBE2314955.1 hypothetical protein [Solirubrobacter deserti]MDA0140186.1 hypothetical protein [Solirubrobacter deserti]
MRPVGEVSFVPRAVLEVERGDAVATCWLGEESACLLVSDVLLELEPDEVELALLRAAGARELPTPEAEPRGYAPGALATAIAAGEFEAHWRIGSVEVLEDASGSWGVFPQTGFVWLHPVSAEWIFAAVRHEVEPRA